MNLFNQFKRFIPNNQAIRLNEPILTGSALKIFIFMIEVICSILCLHFNVIEMIKY